MPLVSYALVTLADTKTFLGISDSSKDAVLEMLINIATDYIQTQTGVFFKSATYSLEEYDGTGTDQIQLRHFPVTAFTKLEVNNATDNTEAWSEISTTDYWVDTDTGIITKTTQFRDFDEGNEDDESLSQTLFFKGKNRYRATYTAGFTNIPYDIQFACMSIAGQMLSSQSGQAIKSESLGDHSITYQDVLSVKGNGSSVVSDILSKYRDIPLAN